ncbi:MAG: decaprenyl-phosphate phosphoribosyltransferase [Prevotella sp.]|nr:decaprenyl-phosphate phosphoribosyltransferase [Prevotella sp.]
MKLREYLNLLRPLQWIKNLFVFAPIFFSNNLLNGEMLVQTIVVFASFCLISSSIYCFNDIKDAAADRLHPKKCHRPIASGRIGISEGYILMAICTLGAFLLLPLTRSSHLSLAFFIIGGYWLMNIAYTLKLKQYAIIDVMIISIGFVMRVLIGGLVANIWISQWLVLMTFLLALFLALAKRSDEFRIYETTGDNTRTSIMGYNTAFINGAIAIVASVTMVCYIMYTMSDEVIERMGTQYLYLTSVWVLAGILRYMQTMNVYGTSGNPTNAVATDRCLHLCIVGWLVSFFVIIYK